MKPSEPGQHDYSAPPRPTDRIGRRRSRWALRILGVKKNELSAVFWSCAYFFFLLCGYYVIRPIRDAMGLTGGVDDLKWLFLVTLGVMLLSNPIFAALVSRYPRRIFVPVVYIFFIANLLLFFLLFKLQTTQNDIYVARMFFVWVSIFNLFAVSVFWGVMADLFRPAQSKRLFGLIGVGGSLGAIVGAAGTTALARPIGINLLPVSAALLTVATVCVFRLNRLVARRAARSRLWPSPAVSEVPDDRISGSALAGFTSVFRSPFLLGICLFLFLHSLSGTFAYFVQGTIVDNTLSDRDSQAALFAGIDLMVNILTVAIQVFLTGRIMKTLGVGATLALLPAAAVVGFLWLGLMPTLSVLVGFQVIRRASNFALAKPARESLFTVVSREDKYKAKHLIDTVAYRGGDALGAGGFALLTSRWVGLGLTGVSFLAVPLGLVWLLIAAFLGRRQHAMVDRRDTARAITPTISEMDW